MFWEVTIKCILEILYIAHSLLRILSSSVRILKTLWRRHLTKFLYPAVFGLTPSWNYIFQGTTTITYSVCYRDSALKNDLRLCWSWGLYPWFLCPLPAYLPFFPASLVDFENVVSLEFNLSFPLVTQLHFINLVYNLW